MGLPDILIHLSDTEFCVGIMKNVISSATP